MNGDEAFGWTIILVICGGLLWAVTDVCIGYGERQAHGEYRACLAARTTAQSDSVAVTLRPECKKWLFPEPPKQ